MKLNKDKLIGKAGKEETPAKPETTATGKATTEATKAAPLAAPEKAPELVAETVAPVKAASAKNGKNQPEASRLEDNRRSTTESRNKAEKDNNEVDVTSEGYLNEQLNKCLYPWDAFKKADENVR